MRRKKIVNKNIGRNPTPTIYWRQWRQVFTHTLRWITVDFYPARYIRDKVLFSIDFFVYFFVSSSARLRENGSTDYHEIFREGAEWLWYDLITFLLNSAKPRDAAMINTGAGFVVLQHHSLLSHDLNIFNSNEFSTFCDFK